MGTKAETVEKQARLSAELVEILGTRSPIGIYVIQGGVLQYVNSEFQKRSGYTQHELIGKSPIKLVPPDDREYVSQNASKMLKGESLSPYEHRFVRKDGTVGWVTETVTHIRYRGRRAILGYFMDITELKELEQELRRSQEKLQRIFDCAPDGVTVNNFDGTVTEINERVVELHGYEGKEEVVGRSAYDFVAPEDHEKMRINLQKTLKNGVTRGVEYEFIRADGSMFPVELASSVLRETNGKPVGFVAVTRDITQRKRDEEALQESQGLGTNLLSNSPNPIVFINADNSVRYVNPALERMTGFSSAELIGRMPPYPWWPKENRSRMLNHFNKELRHGVKSSEMLFCKKNGELFWVKTTSVAVQSKGEIRYCISNWIDVTEQRRLRENMQFYITQVTRAQEEERRRIARELHDDTAQTLTGVCMDIDDILSTKEKLPEIVIERLRQLRCKVDSTLEEVRRFSHELRPVLLDRFGLVPSLELLIAEISKEGGFDCNFKLAGSEQRLSPEEELTLFRITQEALHNASKHSEAKRVVVSLTFARGKTVLSIKDNGSGFEMPELLGDLGREGKLGLIGINERIRLLSGNLYVKSELGKGTSLVAEIPSKSKHTTIDDARLKVAR